MRVVLVALGLLALSACGSEPEAPAPAETAMPVEPNGGIGDGAGAPADAVDETLANRIPTRFQGVWDYVGGTCAPESDLRMEIGGSEILFYESVGTVTGVEQKGDDVMIVTLAMEGEGETWEEKLSLTLADDGTRLVPTIQDPNVGYEPMPRKKCPA